MKETLRSMRMEETLESENIFLVLIDRITLFGYFIRVKNLFKMFEGEEIIKKEFQVPKECIIR